MTRTHDLSPGFHGVPNGMLAAVVTHLEMPRPPTDPAPPVAPPGVSLTRWMPDDPEEYRALFRAVGESWLWFSRLRLGDADLQAVLSDPGIDLFAVRRQGRSVGILELDFRSAPVVELAFFGLRPEEAGQGLGRWLMEEALNRVWDPARAPRTELLTVHTCTLDSPAALPFYLRSGFKAVRREVEIAPDPRADGTLGATAAPQTPLLR